MEDQFVKDQSVKDEWDAVATSISALLTSVGESPVDKRRIGNKRYAEGKLKMIEQNVRKKLKLEPSKDDFQEVLEQLKRKFNGCAKKSEKLQVLTILPQSWSIKRIEMEFGTTNHMARLAKALVASKGILAAPNPRSGKTLSDDTMQLVKLFYLNDTVSRVMPGKKDCVSIVVDGEKEAVQKRLLLCNLSEAYKQFQSDHPDVKIGLTKFTELRPKNVVLAGASGTHNVCVCVLHQNMKLMLEGSKLPLNQSFRNLFGFGDNEALTYKHLLAIMSCNPPLPECLLGECSVCKYVSVDDGCCTASMLKQSIWISIMIWALMKYHTKREYLWTVQH